MSYFSRVGSTERIDLLLSWVVLVIGFSLVIGERRVPSIDLIMISAFGVGTGFLLHELAHKCREKFVYLGSSFAYVLHYLFYRAA